MFMSWVVFCFQVLHITVTASLSWKQVTCSFICSLCHNHIALYHSEKYFCCFLSSAGAQGYCRGLLHAHLPGHPHTEVSVPCWGSEKLGSLLFPKIWLEKPQGPFHSQSSPSTPGVGDVSVSLTWQLRVENKGKKKLYPAPFQESARD